MKKKLLMLMCACLLLGACSTSTPETQEAVIEGPQAVALTFTEQEQEIARMSSTELVGIEFQNYNQGSVFVWAIDEGRVVQEYLIPQYLSEANPMNKMLWDCIFIRQISESVMYPQRFITRQKMGLYWVMPDRWLKQTRHGAKIYLMKRGSLSICINPKGLP